MKQVSNQSVMKRAKGQRGVAAVELAVVLPLFGILLLGVLEVGGMARDHQALQNAAREGARLSAMPSNRMSGKSSADATSIRTKIQERVVAYLQNEKITVATGDVTVDQAYLITIGTTNVNATQITIDYSRPILFPGISRWITLGTTLQGKAVFRNFY